MTLDPRGGLYSPWRVPFILRVTTGADEGKEHTFDGGEATLGRTADNDIVVKDAAASRAHARVYEKKGKFFVEDLGSANGTRVNGAAIKVPKELKGGEIVAIGDVEYEFAIPVEEEEPRRPTRAEDPQSTMDEQGPEFRSTVDPDAAGDDPGATGEVERKPPKALAKKPAAKAKSKRRRDEEDEAEDEPAEDEADPPDDEPDEDEAPVDDGPADLDLADKPRTSLAKALGLKKEAQQSAAERARERRAMQQSIGGKLALAFRDMPVAAKVIVAVSLLIVVVGSVGGAIYLSTKPDKPPKPEPLTLTADVEPLADSFGEGDGVDFRRTAEKAFDFTLNKAMRTVGVLHYQARSIEKDEVKVTLNGTDIESVPPDNLDVENRTNEMVLPADILKPRDQNTLIFDNVRNPPAKDEWRIWNVWVETIPVPEVTSEEAGRQGRITIDNAEKSCELKNVGADSLFRCWKQYREAWLLLESTPSRPAEVLAIAKQRLKEVRPELDRKCSALLIEYQKEVNKGDHNRARAALQDILRHFPTREHPCHTTTKGYLVEYEGVEIESADGVDDYYSRNLKVQKSGCGGCASGDLALAPVGLALWLWRRRRCAAA